MAREQEIQRLVVRLIGESAEFRKMIEDAIRQIRRASKETREAEDDIVKFQRRLNQLGMAFKNVGSAIQSIGFKVSLLGASLAATGYSAVSLAHTFDTNMGRIVGLVGVPREQVEKWKDEVIELTSVVSKSADELSEALFFITSAGFRGEEAMKILEASAKAASAGLGETKVIADTVTSAVNAYGIEVLDAFEATDVLVAAVREGKLEADALAPVLGRLLPTAAKMGISFHQVAGVLAAMSRTGLDAAEAAVSLNAIMRTLLKPSEQARKALEEVGLSIEELRRVAAQPGGLIKMLRMISDAMEGNEDAIARAFPEIRALRGVMNLLAQDAEAVDAVMRGVQNAAGSTEKAFAALKQELSLGTASMALRNLLTQIGRDIMPAVIEVLKVAAGWINKLRKFWESLPAPIQRSVVYLGALVVVLGPLTMGIGTLVSSVGTLIGLLSKLAGTTIGLRLILSGITGAVTAFQYALGPIGIALGVAALAVGKFRSEMRKLRAELQKSAELEEKSRELIVKQVRKEIREVQQIEDPKKREEAFKELYERQKRELQGTRQNLEALRREAERLQPTWRQLWGINIPFIGSLAPQFEAIQAQIREQEERLRMREQLLKEIERAQQQVQQQEIQQEQERIRRNLQAEKDLEERIQQLKQELEIRKELVGATKEQMEVLRLQKELEKLETTDERRKELQKQIESLRQLAEEVRKVTEEEQKRAENQRYVKETISNLEEELKRLKMGSEEWLKYQLAQRGATKEQIERATQMQKEIELLREAKTLKERLKTPEERQRERMNRLNEMLQRGLIDIETYNRALKELKKQTDQRYEAQLAVRGVEAAEAGTAAAISALARFQREIELTKQKAEEVRPVAGRILPGGKADVTAEDPLLSAREQRIRIQESARDNTVYLKRIADAAEKSVSLLSDLNEKEPVTFQVAEVV